MDLTVRNLHGRTLLTWGDVSAPCAVGRSGIGEKLREGDGITPKGRFLLRRVFYRADRLRKPQTILPTEAIQKNGGWCDAPDDENYNRLVTLPYKASAENLWREDHVYDVI